MSSTDPHSATTSSFPSSLNLSDPDAALGPLKPVVDQYRLLNRRYQTLLDRTTPHMLQRWLATAGLLVLFMLRIVLSQGVSVYWPSSSINANKISPLVVYRLVSVLLAWNLTLLTHFLIDINSML